MSNMAVARGNHTATTVANGVVVIGGESNGQVVGAIEVYQNGAWVGAGNLSVARKGHTATRLANGQILIAGGQADVQGNMLLTTCEIFDPATGQVSQGPSLRSPRVDHVACAFTVAGRELVLFAGGISAGGTSVNTAELFDTGTGLITTLPARMLSDRAGGEAVLLPDGNILIQGGIKGWNSVALSAPQPAGSEVFVTGAAGLVGIANAMSFVAPPGSMAIDRYNAGVAVAGNKAVAVGGNSAARLEDSIETFDVASGRWSSSTAKLSVAREDLALVSVRNGAELVALGGIAAGQPSGAVDLIAPNALLAGNGAQARTPLRHARRGHTANVLPGGTVLVVGGFGASGKAIATSEVYDPGAAPGTAPAPQPTTNPGTGIINPGNPGGFPGTTQPGQPPVLPTPGVLAILPATGKPGDIITIAGQNFAQNKNDNLVFFQGGAQGRVLYEARIQNLPMLGTVQTLVVEVPAGAQSGDVVVVVRGQTSAGRAFTIDMQSGGDPRVVYTLPRRQQPGGMVTIFGRNFARPAATNQVTFGGQPGNVVGGLTTQSVPFLGNLAVMVAVVPPGGVTGDLVVTSNGKVSPGYAFEVTGTTPAPPGASNPPAPPANPAPGGSAPAPGGNPAPGGSTPAPAPGAAVLYVEDFEGATVSMSEQGGLWQAARPGPNGPAQAASGQWCAGTAMTSGRYDPGANGFLTTQEIDLSAVTSAELRVNQWFDTDGFDGGRVLVSPDQGATWYLLRPDGGYMTAGIFNPGEGFVGQSGAWLATTFDLSAYAGDRILISFEFAADGIDERAGWFIDDVEVSGF